MSEDAKEMTPLEELLDSYQIEEIEEPKHNKFYEMNLAKRRNAAENRHKFLQLFAGGMSIKDICANMNINYKTYLHWRRNFPEFKEAIDRVRYESSMYGKMDDKQRADQWNDFRTFRKTFFKMETYWHQHQIIDAIESASGSEIVMVLCPPEHGKTTVLEDYINFKLAMDPNYRITYVHESQNFAKRVLRRVSNRMTDSHRYGTYIGAFGPFYVEGQESKGKPWTADMITVNKADHDERDYSLQVRGWNSSVQGTRTDMLLIDDVQAVKSLNLTDKIEIALRQDFFSRPGKEGKIIMVGTRVGVGDIYERFLTDPELSEIIRLIQLPALDQDGNPLCPEMWSRKDLDRKRKLVGEEAWFRNYQQSPLSSGSQTFSIEMIEAAKDETIEACKARPYTTPTIIGVDPALGGQNAIIAASYSDKRMELIDLKVDVGLARVEDILDRINDFAIRYKPTDVVIERETLQKGIARDERLQRMAKHHGFVIREHQTSRAKTDPIIGVSSMASSFLREEIRIPWGTQLAVGRFTPLITELISWRPDIPTRLLKQDTVMALWFVWKHWMMIRNNIQTRDDHIEDPWAFAGIPWR